MNKKYASILFITIALLLAQNMSGMRRHRQRPQPITFQQFKRNDFTQAIADVTYCDTLHKRRLKLTARAVDQLYRFFRDSSLSNITQEDFSQGQKTIEDDIKAEVVVGGFVKITSVSFFAAYRFKRWRGMKPEEIIPRRREAISPEKVEAWAVKLKTLATSS